MQSDSNKGELSPRVIVQLVIIAIVGIAALVWSNYRFAESNPGGNDFIPRWVGTRLFLEDGQNPYGEETTLAIQEAIYGRAAESGDDEALFAYPFFSMIVFAPFSTTNDYVFSRALWTTTLQLALVATAIIAVVLSGWRPNRSGLTVFLLFSILWYHGARPMINGNAAILVAFFIAVGLWLLRKKQDAWAGVALAFATIKPQMVLLYIPLIFIWALSHKRYRVVMSFSLSLLVLLSGSLWLQPGWLADAINQIMTYSSYTPPGTPATIFAQWWPENGLLLGRGLSAFLLLVLLWEWWLSLGKNFEWLLWSASLTLVLTQLVGVPTTTANYASMLIVFPVVFAAWERRFDREQNRAILISLVIVFLGLWLLFTSTMLPGTQFREHLIMLFPVPIVLLLNLYWLRWWALRPAEITYPARRARRKKGK
jgi:hypothetical protein